MMSYYWTRHETSILTARPTLCIGIPGQDTHKSDTPHTCHEYTYLLHLLVQHLWQYRRYT